MRFSPVWISSVLLVLVSFTAFGQTSEKATPAPLSSEMKGLPPRATPADYQAQGQAGTVTIGAEFSGHSVPRPEGPLTTEEFVVVEAGFFGSAGARLALSPEDFSLRVNGKKGLLPGQPWGLVAHSLKDPSWIAPEEADPKPKSKGGLSTGGQTDSSSLPVVIHVPIALQRAMAQYVQKSSMPEGDRPLPQAGLLFFQYRGPAKSIHSLELMYSGPAGKAAISLQP